jgi:hypothetical protein
MSFLYDVALLRTGPAPFSFQDIDVCDLPSTTLFAPVVKDAEPDLLEGESVSDRATRMRAWTAARVAAATEDELRALIAGATGNGSRTSRSTDEVLALLQEPGANVWERCVPGTNESSLATGMDLVWLQLLLSDGLPGRFASPSWVHEVALMISAAHPDVGDFEVSHSMAARLLMDADAHYPLRRIWPDYASPLEGAASVLLALAVSDNVEIPHPSDEESPYHEKECHLWLPAHLTGNLREKGTWESAAFSDS